MSVIIKGMRFPDTCDECRFCEYEEGRCVADEQDRISKPYTRPEWCPLEEVKVIRKCGDCVHLCGKRTTVGIECMEPSLQWKWSGKYYRNKYARYKYPSTRACKMFQPKPPKP